MEEEKREFPLSQNLLISLLSLIPALLYPSLTQADSKTRKMIIH
jgi:hypothetical protein